MVYNLSTKGNLPPLDGRLPRRRTVALLLGLGFLALTASAAGAQQSPGHASAAHPRIDLAGTWKGTLVNLPTRAAAPAVEVEIELGALPDTAGRCVPWKTTYREGGVVRGVKDYQLCRGASPTDYVVDEGGGVRLRANLLGDVLVSAFKSGAILLVTHLRVRGDTLEEEIVTITDAPTDTGLVTMPARSIQRIVAVRQR